MSDFNTELAVIGAGPGGYAAAFRAADLGFKVTLIDKELEPGGVCLYRGCIPSKALLHLAYLLNSAKKSAEAGIEFGEPRIDLNKIRDYKNNIVKKMTSGLATLNKYRKIQYLSGTGTFKGNNKIEVRSENGDLHLVAYQNAIVATGSLPVNPPIFNMAHPDIMDSTLALETESIPESLLCVGGGIIGMELATVYLALGSKVTIVEALPDVLGPVDSDIIRLFMRKMKKQLAAVYTGSQVTDIKEIEKGFEVSFTGPKTPEEPQRFDSILVCTGRSPNSKGLGLENTSVAISEKGFIEVDKNLETREKGIFAVGDVIGQPMLAHKASHEAHRVIHYLKNSSPGYIPTSIPSVIYTHPEIAWCGLTEKEAVDKNIPYKAVKFPWAALGRAVSIHESDGASKLIVDPGTHRILGAGIMGTAAGDLISECNMAVELNLTAQDLAKCIHPHPTFSESIMEAAEMYLGHSDHYLVKKLQD